MLAEFEARLVDVLGSRLPAPFAGRVRRRGAAAPNGAGPVVTIGIDTFDPVDPDVGSVRPEVVPGSDDQRRVVRLGVTLGIGVSPADNAGRAQQLAGVDAIVYELGDPEMASAKALRAPGDQGFVIERLTLGTSTPDADLGIDAVGWFWPVGVAGETGRPIERAVVREFRLPVRLGFGGEVVAGGAGVELSLALGGVGALSITRDDVVRSPFGSVALRLVTAGGAPGAGTLSGAAGPDGARTVPVADGAARVGYTPPAAATTEYLVVSAHAVDTEGNQRVGVEIARFQIVVRP